MAKPDAKKWPLLKASWDAYGHSITWDQLIDMKSGRGHYVVVAWKNGDRIEMADLARYDSTWEMQNDGFESITAAEWKKLRITPECDSFEIPGKVWYW